MNVRPSFSPAELSVAPGATAGITLHLENTTDDEQVVELVAAGDLAEHLVLQSQSVHLDPNEQFDVPVIVDPGTSLTAGVHEFRVDVNVSGESESVSARVDVEPFSLFTARLEPPRSRSSRAGRHTVAVENTGNTAVMVELIPSTEPDISSELAAASVTVEPGKTANVELRLTPFARHWSGEPEHHEFRVEVSGSNGEQFALDGEYEQVPRVPPWFGAALAGMLGALVLWAILWWLLMRPAVEDIARSEASELDDAQQEVLDAQVEAIQIAADEASELPLGEPTDLRLTVSAPGGSEAIEAFDFDRSGSGRTLSISDIIFQNPTGAVGTVEFLRDDQVLLQQEMANFRDLDFHLVAPFRVESGSSIALRVVCATPGPTTGECQAAATIVGFVDDAP